MMRCENLPSWANCRGSTLLQMARILFRCKSGLFGLLQSRHCTSWEFGDLDTCYFLDFDRIFQMEIIIWEMYFSVSELINE